MIKDRIKHVEPDPVKATNRKRSLHESYKVFRNCNSSSMAKSEVQDTISEVNPSICPPFARIKQTGMETTQNPLELNLVSRKKRKRGSQKTKTYLVQNSGQTQKLPEEGCWTSTNHTSIMSTPSLSDERNSEGKVVSLGTDETNSFSVTNSSRHLSHNNSINFCNANSFLMTKSEVQDAILGVGSTICPSFARIEQTGMETSQNLVEVNVVSRKKRNRGSRKKKAKALQNSGQAQKLPEQGCVTSTNHTNIVSTLSVSNEINSEEKVVSFGTDEINYLRVTNSSQNLSHDNYKVFSNADSYSMAKSEVQGTILGVDLTLCPSLARIERTGMETAHNPVEVNVVSQKKSRRSRKRKPKALQNSGQAEKLPEEGCVTSIMNIVSTRSHHMNIMSIPSVLDEKNSEEKYISLGTDAINSFPVTDSSQSLSHENHKVFSNAKPFSMSKNEVQDIILGVNSTRGPSFARIEQVGKETTQNSVHVILPSKKKKRRQKKCDALQNSGEAQKLPEESCPSIRNHTNIISTRTPSDEKNTEEKGSSLGGSENNSLSLANFSPRLSHENCKVFSDTNSFPMSKSEMRDSTIGTDATNSFPVTDFSRSLSHENQKVFSNATPFSTIKSEVQDIILGMDSIRCPSFASIEQVGRETTQNSVHENPASKKKKRRSRKKKSNALQNSGEAQKLPEESCPSIRNHMNIISTQSDEKNTEEKGSSLGASDNNSFSLIKISPRLSHANSKVFSDTNSFPMTKSEMQDSTSGVDSSICPALARIERTGMETTNNPVEVNMLIKKKKRRSRKKKSNALHNSGEGQKLLEEGSRIKTDCMNTVSTVGLLNKKNSEERVISSGADENKQVYLAVANEEDNCSEIAYSRLVRAPIGHLRKKLLILDINGLLADIVRPPPKKHKSDINIAGRAIFKRPFCLDFLTFCFEIFEVGVWSSRSKKNVEKVIDYLMGDMKHRLLLCWDQSHCTATKFRTLEDKHKPMVFKELRRIWEKHDPNLPWEKGDYNESNTLLLDDSPYKALLNPLHTAIFPHSYTFQKKSDKSLGAGGDLRVYLEGLAVAENTQKYVERNPLGQSPITQRSKSWDFYQTVIRSLKSLPTTG